MVLSGNEVKMDALRLNPVRFSGAEGIFGSLPLGPSKTSTSYIMGPS